MTASDQKRKRNVNTKSIPSLWKLSHLLSHRSSYSRRDGKRLILEGNVTVYGHVVQEPASLVLQNAVIKIHGSLLKCLEHPRLWLTYKPRGYLVSRGDPQGRACFFDILPPKIRPFVISVGRLDINSEGLLLLTNHGMLARSLEHPKQNLRRHYRVRAFGVLPQDLPCLKYKKYVVKNHVLGPVKIIPIKKTWKKIKEHQSSAHNHWMDVYLKSGRYREVRRLLEYLELRVNRLIRLSYGSFFLNNLQPGEIHEVKDTATFPKMITVL